MKRAVFAALMLLLAGQAMGETMKEMALPKPRTKGSVPVEEAIHKRRSVRAYAKTDVAAEDVSQLLWACQGITDERAGLRASPSAGALYPLEIYLAKKDGLYHYIPAGHRLETVLAEDVRAGLAAAAHGQRFVEEAPLAIIICAVYERVTGRYGDRGIRYTDMEAGHAAENVFLQAVALGLDSVAVGAFTDAAVARAMKLPRDQKPLYILPVGYKK